MKKRKLLGLQMVLGLRFGAGAATSDAGAGAPVAPALATGLLSGSMLWVSGFQFNPISLFF